MSHHLSSLLRQWYPNRDRFEWVLATIYNTEGSCYRKSGAMMLFSSTGEQLGLLSGGCLESDISLNAQKVMLSGKPRLICYDGSDEDDVSFHLGIGCGGTIYIMLQKIAAGNNYLELTKLHTAFQNRTSGIYYQKIIDTEKHCTAYFEPQAIEHFSATAKLVTQNKQEKWLATPIIPAPYILIIGAGVDAKPLVNMAQQLGWQIALWDPRPANARKEHFPQVDYILKVEAQDLAVFAQKQHVTAAILMSHNVAIDAQALQALAKIKLGYVALLGPKARKQQVLVQANLTEEALPFALSGPAGLDIGALLPESIALSILAECHSVLYKSNTK